MFDSTHRLLTLICIIAGAGTISGLPVAARAQPIDLTLEAAIEAGLSSHAMVAARQSVIQAQAELKGASAIPNPSVSLEGGMIPLTRRFTEDRPGGPTDITAGISFPIDWLIFGKRWAVLDTAKISVGLAEAEYADVQRLHVLEIEQAFFNVLESEALLKIAGRTVRELSQTEEAIRKAVEEGERPQMELRRVALELQAAKREERDNVTSRLEALAVLAALTGHEGSLSEIHVTGNLDDP